MNKEIKRNLLSPSMWLRIMYMVIFLVVGYLLLHLMIIIAMIQTVSNLITGKSIEPVWVFSRGLNQYLLQIVDFLTFRAEEKPFPFLDWPGYERKKPAVTKDEDGEV